MAELARIEKVDLREIWANEAADFTPWLQENIDQLGDALGMDLEVEEREASVGTFSLDLLARDGSGRPVIIENQLGTTDHTHLGQILTCAAGQNASVIVWIAKKFRDEHRAALDFLNSRTGEDTEFFGVGVELWRIEGSRAAVNFDLVVTPNEWRKGAASTPRESGPSERGEKYRLFFQALMDALREDHQFTRARKAQSRKAGTRFHPVPVGLPTAPISPHMGGPVSSSTSTPPSENETSGRSTGWSNRRSCSNPSWRRHWNGNDWKIAEQAAYRFFAQAP